MIPETIYLQYVEGDDALWTDTTWCDVRINDDDIVYDRRKTCVWEIATDGKAQHRGHGAVWSPENVRMWRFCPFCGGRVEITDCDAKGKA